MKHELWQLCPQEFRSSNSAIIMSEDYVIVVTKRHGRAEDVIGPARLVAATPDLYVALKRVLSYGGFFDYELVAQIQDVIAKVEGRNL
jgi:hypothetical protein